jgi:hypothetical protein
MEIEAGDICDRDSVVKAFKGAEVVFHLVALIRYPILLSRAPFLHSYQRGRQLERSTGRTGQWRGACRPDLYERSLRHGSGSADPRDPLFVIGVYRSGTTLIAQFLNNHPELRVTHETLHFFRFYLGADLGLNDRYRDIIEDARTRLDDRHIAPRRRFPRWSGSQRQVREHGRQEHRSQIDLGVISQSYTGRPSEALLVCILGS